MSQVQIKLDDNIYSSSSVAYSQGSGIKNVSQIAGFAIDYNVVVAGSNAVTFVDGNVDVNANTVVIVAHGFVTARKVAATTSGALPGGLSATNYWAIVVDANTIKVATNSANAVAGTAVDITSAAGGGTHTLTPAALAGASLKVQGSLDQVIWGDISGANVDISVDATGLWNLTDQQYRHVRLYSTLTAGQLLLNSKIFSKGQ